VPRPRFTPEQRQAILGRYRRSGLKQQEFIAREGISKATLGKWLQGERRRAKASIGRPRFQELLVAPAALSPWQFEIVSPTNWTMRFAAMPNTSGLEPLLRSLPC
jgi:transposase-like protein